MTDLRGKDRIIVALDVPTVDEALVSVERLDNISFFKVEIGRASCRERVLLGV